MLSFGVRRLLSLKNCQMRPQNSFLRFSLKIQSFSKKLLNKKIFNIKFLIKKAIFIFGVRWPLTGRTVTQLDVLQTFAPFKPHFYVPKYRSSGALPAPEFFFVLKGHDSSWTLNTPLGIFSWSRRVAQNAFPNSDFHFHSHFWDQISSTLPALSTLDSALTSILDTTYWRRNFFKIVASNFHTPVPKTDANIFDAWRVSSKPKCRDYRA